MAFFARMKRFVKEVNSLIPYFLPFFIYTRPWDNDTNQLRNSS